MTNIIYTLCEAFGPACGILLGVLAAFVAGTVLTNPAQSKPEAKFDGTYVHPGIRKEK